MRWREEAGRRVPVVCHVIPAAPRVNPPISVVLCLVGMERSGGRRGGIEKKKGVAFARLESNLSVFNGRSISIAIESYINVGYGRPARPLPGM